MITGLDALKYMGGIAQVKCRDHSDFLSIYFFGLCEVSLYVAQFACVGVSSPLVYDFRGQTQLIRLGSSLLTSISCMNLESQWALEPIHLRYLGMILCVSACLCVYVCLSPCLRQSFSPTVSVCVCSIRDKGNEWESMHTTFHYCDKYLSNLLLPRNLGFAFRSFISLIKEFKMNSQ